MCDTDRPRVAATARGPVDVELEHPAWLELYGRTDTPAAPARPSAVRVACDSPSCPEDATAAVRPARPIEGVVPGVRLCDEHLGVYLSALWGAYGVRGVVSAWV